MVDTRNFHRVVNVLDDFPPVHTWQLSLLDKFAREPVAFDELTGFILPATLFDLRTDTFVDLGIGLFRIAEGLAEETNVVIDLNDAAFRGDRKNARRSGGPCWFRARHKTSCR